MIRFGMGNLLNTFITCKARYYPIALYEHYILKYFVLSGLFFIYIKILANTNCFSKNFKSLNTIFIIEFIKFNIFRIKQHNLHKTF